MIGKIKVLEFASVLAGPSVGQFFAEIGAEVIKVENPNSGGDVTRSWLSDGEEPLKTVSAYFSSVNWGKKSISLDLKKAEDLKIIYQLVPQCDIVISSFKPGADVELGVDYATLIKYKHDLIYGHVTGYGAENRRVGYDAVIQAESGFMSINGEKNGSPLKMPVALVDILAGHHLKEGLLLALLNKIQTGEGSYVPVSLFDAAISSLANQGTNWLVANKVPSQSGNEHPNIAPYGDVFETFDGVKIILAVGNDKQFKNLCEVLNTNLFSVEQFSSNSQRVKNRKVLHELILEKIVQLNSELLLLELNNKMVPAGLIKNIKEVLETIPLSKFHADKELKGIKNFIGLPHNFKKVKLTSPPQLGQHNQEILREL
jgi:crotonobetainyl-CoA:carnitine CoA-transferase CaiB-like acyl-CoA transferase